MIHILAEAGVPKNKLADELEESEYERKRIT